VYLVSFPAGRCRMQADIVLVVSLGFGQEPLGHVVVRKLSCYMLLCSMVLQHRRVGWSSVVHSIVHIGQFFARLQATCLYAVMWSDVEFSCP